MLKCTEKTLAEIINYVNDLTDLTIITTNGTTSFAFLWFNQTEYLETNCNKQGELTSPCVLV